MQENKELTKNVTSRKRIWKTEEFDYILETTRKKQAFSKELNIDKLFEVLKWCSRSDEVMKPQDLYLKFMEVLPDQVSK